MPCRNQNFRRDFKFNPVSSPVPSPGPTSLAEVGRQLLSSPSPLTSSPGAGGKFLPVRSWLFTVPAGATQAWPLAACGPTGSVLGTHVCTPGSGRADLRQLSFGPSESRHTTFASLGRELDGRCHMSTLQGTDMKFVSLGSGGEGSPRPLPRQLSHFSPPTPSYILDAGERL